ncbi:FecCD family ABC transporter permease [Speluncibacter jeojiensis]|uniref:Iron chelate uptake ABC transporter family permease subunit n=1 Tax=Speluncibacter jeojiensis TaxID=2710754 RepID=A0A9X4LYB9_9ACTN|nr:iron chelate uptake ABC transporter family permease subunit [Corynebacteriales bacterium D3-21]
MTVSTNSVLRAGTLSVRWRPRVVVVNVALLGLIAAVLCLSLSRGDVAVPFGEVLRALGGAGRRFDRVIVLDFRLPRAITAVVVGAALGMAGAVTQAVSRNPLASPDILGVTAGCAAAAVALMVSVGGGISGALTVGGVPAAAVCGGLLTAAAIYLLSWRGGVLGMRLILVGVAINAMLLAVVQWLLVRADIADATRAQVWISGSLSTSGWGQAWPTAVAVVVVGGALIGSVRLRSALQLGEDTAGALGVRVSGGQAMLLLGAVLLAAVATAAAGPVGFIALAAPHIAQRLVRTVGQPVFASALVGAVLVIGADVIARTMLPAELPVGIVTVVLGAPFLLVQLVRQNRRHRA